MRNYNICIVLQVLGYLLGAAYLSGCAYTNAKPMSYGDKSTRGFRIYDAKPLLVTTPSEAKVIYVPDREHGYAVRFGAIFAKNDVELNVNDAGVLDSLKSNLDSSGFLTFVSTLGAKALEKGESVFSAFGLPTTGTRAQEIAIWDFVYDSTGKLIGLKKLASVPAVATQSAARAQTPPPSDGAEK